jgi:hypothetical protein
VDSLASVDWEVPFLVAVIVVAIVYLTGRTKGETSSLPDHPTSGAELIDRLQKTLGMAIVVESIEPMERLETAVTGGSSEPTTIRATLMFGRYTARVVATGPSESDAWADLAKLAIEWRNSDYQHIPMWGGGA